VVASGAERGDEVVGEHAVRTRDQHAKGLAHRPSLA
jgi:hypothetical protein